jgi:predicted Rossmann fold nucleotide-binding protein DprA/Smf involved in DNA uptake
MQATDIIITNILPTGTAFAVVADDIGESVFVPSRLLHGTDVRAADRVAAMLVPNSTRPDKTPWVAISIVTSQPEPPRDTLADLILKDLEQGRATVEEIAESLNMADDKIAAKLAEMTADGRVVRLTCFDLPEGDE